MVYGGMLPKVLVDAAQCSCEPLENGSYKVTLIVSQQTLAQAASMVHILAELHRRLHHEVSCAATAVNGTRIAQQFHAKCRALAGMYWTLRKGGMKHRAAIAAVAESPLAKEIGYGKTEVGWAVREYLVELTAVEGGQHG